MSRCFPFPPPGYERKIKADDLILLRKEKHREKKHKKEKKNKEKKESKEKEKRDEKHREKKDRKEKHRDNTKDKEKDRDKDKHRGKSLLDDGKKTARPPNTYLDKSSDKSKEWTDDKTAFSCEKRVDVPACNGESFTKTNHVAPQSKTSGYVWELGRRTTDDERRNNNQLFDKNVAAETKKDGLVKIGWVGAAFIANGKEKAKENCALDGRMESVRVNEEAKFCGNALGQNSVRVVKLAEKCAGPLVDGRERKDKPAADGKMDRQVIGRDFRSSGSALPPNSVGMVQNSVGAMVRPVDKKPEQKVEGNERIKEKEGDDRKTEKRKERDSEKSIKKGKDRETEKKKEEKVSNPMRVQMARMIDGSDRHILTPAKDDNKGDFPGPQSSGILNIPRVSNHSGDTINTSLGKRKNAGVNGTYDEHISGPNKLARTDSTHQVDNGKSLEACQNSAVCAPVVQRPPMNIKVERTFAPDDTQRPPTNIKVDGEVHKINGINGWPLSQPSQATAKVERKSDVSLKPPHPDAKYLSQILSVPEMDEWSGCDDQDWLFSHKGSQTRPEGESSTVEETPEVWAKALWLPPVDMFALPYVIPH